MIRRHRVLPLVAIAILFAGENLAVGQNIWRIESGPIDPSHYFGESVANGMIGLLSSTAPFRTRQTLIYGAFEPMWPGSVPGSARGFNFLDLDVRVDGVELGDITQVQNFRQVLNLKGASFVTSFDYGNKLSVSYTLRALRNLPFTALLSVSATAHQPVTLSVASRLTAPEKGNIRSRTVVHTFDWLQGIVRGVTDVPLGKGEAQRIVHVFAARAKGATGGITVAAAQAFLFEDEARSPKLSVDPDGLSFSQSLRRGEEFKFASVGSIITSAHVADPSNEAQRLTLAAVIRGLPDLVSAHEQAWADLWKSDVVIEGDERTQRDIHDILYHLYSAVREGSGYSIPPMGLFGNTRDYLGHIFWDAETWMFPGLLALKPQLARSMIDYRFSRLDAARRNAARHGYRGAQFPWESAATGDEDDWVEATSGEMEVHITADVALAAWNYYRVTQDEEWLASHGYTIIQAAADFWVSRVSKEGPGRYCIRHVIGADENAEDVDNDAFTNAAARENLRAASAAARLLGLAPDPEWSEAADNIPIEHFPNGVTREHEQYTGQKTWQADVMLLAYPLGVITEPAQIERDLAYYDSGRNDDESGPAMMKSISSILYTRLGQSDRALKIFQKGYLPNQRPPFGALAESASSDNPYFLTGAGGLLQTVLYGFGGLRITDEGLRQVPAPLPSAWRSLTLTGIGTELKTFTQSEHLPK